MRIACVVPTFPVVSETFVINQVTGLLDRGQDVRILARTRGDTSSIHRDVVAYGLCDRAIYQPTRPARRTLRIAKGAALLMRAAWRTPGMAGRLLSRGRRDRAWRWYDAAVLWGQQYDIIHAQFGPEGLRALYLRDAGIISGKLITHFRGHDISKVIKIHGDSYYAPLFERGDLFLTNCEFFRRRLVEIGCPADRLLVHRSGTDVGAFDYRVRRPPAKEPYRLLTVGRLAAKKGLQYAVEACRILSDHGCAVRYDIIGDGPMRPMLEDLIRQLRLQNTVRLLGRRIQTEIRSALNDADIFIAPSITSNEGDQDAPVNVLKEAMVSGLPVVATAHGGIPELVEDGVSGYLVPERDSAALAAALERLMQHPEVWAGMGRAGRERVQRDYDIDVLNDRLVAIYEALLAGRTPGAAEAASFLDTASVSASRWAERAGSSPAG